MHTRTLKTLALALTFWLALHCSTLRAQLLATTSNSVASFGVDSNGLLFATGTIGTGSLSLSGAGTRMFWYPKQAAFRAGNVSGTLWDSANIGAYSVAFGHSTKASGQYSFAMGSLSVASGDGSLAVGINAVASGFASSSLGGYSTASGDYSTALGAGTASGPSSTASGYSLASGSASFTSGYGTTASGDCSTASGLYTTASSYASTAFGTFNVGGGNPSTYVSTDPLLELGNGTDATHKSDALIVYKNGNAIFQGVVSVAPSGDIPMFGH